MAPYKPILLLSLLFTSASHAHWIPFQPDMAPDAISDLRLKEMDSPQGQPNKAQYPTTAWIYEYTTIHFETMHMTQRDTQSVAQPTQAAMVMRSDFPQLVPGLNNSFGLNSSYGCGYGMSNCGHIGMPNICCPDILIISPLQVSLENSCFQTERSTLGVICCQDPIMCERIEHHPDEYPMYNLTCSFGTHECSAELGGGCCPEGFSCDSDSCYHNLTNDTYTGPLGGDPRETEYPPYPPKTSSSTETVSTYPTDGPRYRVRKSAVNVLKTGETDECIEPRCQNPLSGLTNGIGQALQSVVDGSDVILTLTKAVDGVATHIPGASGLLGQLGGSNNTLNIINGVGGALGKALKSDGSSFMKRSSTVWPRIFSGGHIQYLALSLIINGVIGMRLNPARILLDRRIRI
ncbi:hypothetical protein TWF506_003918 [Arthrobotrys conoides]|uniref:Uncharacterized protein n=1 Tax=Arthrobotrys conoides TaxID=74498 RepID=A0AAN8MX73_9PEZI